MFLTTRFIIKKISFHGMVLILIVIALSLSPLLASADEDSCSEKGIYIGNQTSLDLWCTRNGGPCTIWVHGHTLTIKPEDTLILFRNVTCSTQYCPTNPTYDACKSLDLNRDCRVKILSRCTFSDM
jgi:hypothetical protein